MTQNIVHMRSEDDFRIDTIRRYPAIDKLTALLNNEPVMISGLKYRMSQFHQGFQLTVWNEQTKNWDNTTMELDDFINLSQTGM